MVNEPKGNGDKESKEDSEGDEPVRFAKCESDEDGWCEVNGGVHG